MIAALLLENVLDSRENRKKMVADSHGLDLCKRRKLVNQ